MVTHDIQNNNERAALKAIAPLSYPNIPKQSEDPYHGADGRPDDSVEVIFTRRQPMLNRTVPPDPQGRATVLLQNFWRFFSAPRIRAARYDPTLPKGKVTRPGTTRLPGPYGAELSSREASALAYLLSCGRLGEMTRSL